MSMTPDLLIQPLQSNHYVLLKQGQGVTHADSIKQAPFPVNCYNWVLGHIIQHRDLMLELLGASPLLTEAQADLYRAGSDPISEESEAMPFEQLMELLTVSQTKLMALLGESSVESLALLPESGGERTIGSRLRGLVWHESYHVGQTEYTRQIAGKNDQIL